MTIEEIKKKDWLHCDKGEKYYQCNDKFVDYDEDANDFFCKQCGSQWINMGYTDEEKKAMRESIARQMKEMNNEKNVEG